MDTLADLYRRELDLPNAVFTYSLSKEALGHQRIQGFTNSADGILNRSPLNFNQLIKRGSVKQFNITLCRATEKDKDIIQNLGRFYVYDMSRYCGFLSGWEVPANGLFECIDLSSYCEQPDGHAFLIKVDGELAGFVLIDKIGSTPDVDWNVGEFFIVSKFQGKGIGRYAAEQVFNQFPGIWETSQIPENKAALDFWERIVDNYANGKYEKSLKTIVEPKPHPMVVLKFSSNGRKSKGGVEI